MDYKREIDLPRILKNPFVHSKLLGDFSAAGTAQIITLIDQARRDERLRGVRGHYSYNEQRHAALKNALDAECKHMDTLAREAAE